MPSTSVSVRGALPEGGPKAILEGVHAALVEALRIPPGDRCLRLQHFTNETFVLPEPQPERYVLVEIDLFPGRSLEAKRKLYRAIVDRLAPLGYPASGIRIVLREIPLQNWGIRGGQPASDVQLGFQIEV